MVHYCTGLQSQNSSELRFCVLLGWGGTCRLLAGYALATPVPCAAPVALPPADCCDEAVVAGVPAVCAGCCACAHDWCQDRGGQGCKESHLLMALQL